MAPNFSKFYEDALKEGLGLVEFIELHHPGEADLKEIKPKMDMPYKGYFPSGKICKVFGKEFNDWSRSFTARTRGEKNKKMLEFFITRVKTTTGNSCPSIMAAHENCSNSCVYHRSFLDKGRSHRLWQWICSW